MDLAISGFTQVSLAVLLLLCAYEWLTGKYKDGKKTAQDWKMFSISNLGINLIERPLQLFLVFFFMDMFLPEQKGTLAWIDEQYLLASLIIYTLVDEFIHGAAHNFAHGRKPKNKFLARVQSFYKGAHRPHHMNGGNDGHGEISATHTAVAGWGWTFSLPNYLIGIICLYLGLVETWILATLIKTVWGIHTHCNWRYDLYLLNHPNKLISKTMYALCHIFTFPNQHHQHHSRSKNSAKNMNVFLSLFDWLCWKTLVIEFDRPKVSGWKQNEKEENSVLYRYFHRSIKA
jgi:hypothetical protein